MPKGPIPHEKMEALQAETGLRAVATAIPPGNVEAATTLHDEARLYYRGRWYRVPRVPFREGIWLQALDFEWRQLGVMEPTTEVLEQTLKVATAIVDLGWRLVRRPPLWRLLRPRFNPFADAERDEIDALLHFFSAARTISPVGWVASVRAPSWVLPTSPTTSAGLRIGSHAGWRRRASPVATATSSSGSRRWPMNRFAPLGYRTT